ncbi:RNase H family protein [Erythrobacter mangrovi]|uniref:RNA-directed DNA polymerase n=1 Tax=Erythrobacter mangrovi TaxID=2739433 RepID=A0A7D4CDM4_9SPHN|nr:RNase H family protein [Erythrobacter mangrovi]QKG71769.1 RNA-directed DNA polymerase [Erythrobacter mangrovi]
MGKLFDIASEQNNLFAAWRHIRSNGLSSKSFETRSAVEAFDEDPVRNIRSIQSLLRNGKFEFDYQTGILKSKAGGKKRGIVLASVRNRIVERAILDTLQTRCQFVKDVNSCATSVGGVPNRSVPHGIKLILDAFEDGKSYFVRSDISGFFDHIPRRAVIGYMREQISDQRFLSLIDQATTVTLANETALGENRSVFPTNEEGVAQGSPLSALFGNILLSGFDQQLNSDETVCVRFIDDFVILGKSEDLVRSVFGQAVQTLKELNLDCKNPFSEKCDPAKADYGAVSEKIIFLGHQIEPGLWQPARAARQELLQKIRAQFAAGRTAIKDVKARSDSFAAKSRYIQTLELVDRIIAGWAQSFAYCNSRSTFFDLDAKIDEELLNFRRFFREQCAPLDDRGKRRLWGVRLVADVPIKTFDELPRIVKVDGRYVSAKSITVSTDGSICRSKKSGATSSGPGGWAFVTHGSDVTGSGYEISTTNNRMELLAVVKALEHYAKGPLVIRTDSQYVERTANGKQIAKANADLWDRFEAASTGRKVRIDWVKGHSGDPHNDQADLMAKAQASFAATKSAKQ